MKALEFIHFPSIGNLVTCSDTLMSIAPFIDKMCDDFILEGYAFHVLTSEQDSEFSNYHLAHIHQEITSNVFPFFYIAIQPKSDETDISELWKIITSDFYPLKRKSNDIQNTMEVGAQINT